MSIKKSSVRNLHINASLGKLVIFDFHFHLSLKSQKLVPWGAGFSSQNAATADEQALHYSSSPTYKKKISHQDVLSSHLRAVK